MTRDFDRWLECLDVARGTRKITTLFLVGNHPGIRPSLIAEIIFKDRSAMGCVLDDMEGHGPLRREVAGDDSRAQEPFLTPKGEALALQVRAIVKDSREFFAGTDNADYAELVNQLRRIYWRIVANKGASA
ncbi:MULTISPECIES: MarR family winged helix-turn-helix transcriptional regulator [unclassified Aureimonas]|uniref:MarR family winged helix-turn-helix transcriptional regulator n=1 Tax=unclassified Aureimonas TaxID=2615206 RepID=UPI0007204AC2|nr:MULTISPECIES: MarR family winged helix-turn-helix transcriptional regulator [unclassified Aureimonas]ALN71825.1 hypothetical protein M673_03810 [Aureimonas sp. AU20]